MALPPKVNVPHRDFRKFLAPGFSRVRYFHSPVPRQFWQQLLRGKRLTTVAHCSLFRVVVMVLRNQPVGLSICRPPFLMKSTERWQNANMLYGLIQNPFDPMGQEGWRENVLRVFCNQANKKVRLVSWRKLMKFAPNKI